jgi:hypothetical protein
MVVESEDWKSHLPGVKLVTPGGKRSVQVDPNSSLMACFISSPHLFPGFDSITSLRESAFCLDRGVQYFMDFLSQSPLESSTYVFERTCVIFSLVHLFPQVDWIGAKSFKCCL